MSEIRRASEGMILGKKNEDLSQERPPDRSSIGLPPVELPITVPEKLHVPNPENRKRKARFDPKQLTITVPKHGNTADRVPVPVNDVPKDNLNTSDFPSLASVGLLDPGPPLSPNLNLSLVGSLSGQIPWTPSPKPSSTPNSFQNYVIEPPALKKRKYNDSEL